MGNLYVAHNSHINSIIKTNLFFEIESYIFRKDLY